MQIAGAEGNLVLVGAGLAAGETVVTAGVHALTEGQKVRWYAEPGAALAPPAASAVPRQPGHSPASNPVRRPPPRADRHWSPSQ